MRKESTRHLLGLGDSVEQVHSEPTPLERAAQWAGDIHNLFGLAGIMLTVVLLPGLLHTRGLLFAEEDKNRALTQKIATQERVIAELSGSMDSAIARLDALSEGAEVAAAAEEEPPAVPRAILFNPALHSDL